MWAQLLALPEEKRVYRSVWAAYMIAKACLNVREQAHAIRYFEMARDLQEKGFKDSLDLGFSSYGWQALAEYEEGEYVESLHHYLKHMDISSIRWWCKNISVLPEEEYKKVINDKLARKVFIAWYLSKNPWHMKGNMSKGSVIQWLRDEIAENKISIDAQYVDKMALLYYNVGEYTTAQEWLASVDEPTALGRWVQAKLLLLCLKRGIIGWDFLQQI